MLATWFDYRYGYMLARFLDWLSPLPQGRAQTNIMTFGRQGMSTVKAAHHRGPHQVRAKRVTDQARANPTTRCRRCGKTYREGLLLWGTVGAKWTAGHIVDGQVGGPYAPEHAHCNYSAGASAGNKNRVETHTERWW